MRLIGSVLGLGVAALLSACGGGGGSAGDTQLEYKITLRADKTLLPVNIAGEGAGIGTYAPYTTTLYVNATEDGKPVLGGEDTFACNVEAGLDVGALYYLDGDDEHEDDDGNPLAYRSITLDSNSGGNSFHFHAGPTAGTARIVCTITNPRDNQVSSASVNITVGGTSNNASGMPASVQWYAQAPYAGYLGVIGNPNSIRNNVALQAMLRDETNQWVKNPTAPNVQVSIVGGAGAYGARLLSGTQSGTIVQTSTRNGLAGFSLSSGSSRGVILLSLVSDRADNNVANGIQDPISQLMAIRVVNNVASEPLVVPAQTVEATCKQAVSYALAATGGVPPYKWEALGDLPNGLALSEDGVVSGVPKSLNGTNSGSYPVVVRVTDDEGAVVTQNMTFQVDTGACAPLALGAATITLLEDTTVAFALSATGGTPPYEWAAVAGLPPGLSLSKEGVLTGSVANPGTYNAVVKVKDADGIEVQGNLAITVTEAAP